MIIVVIYIYIYIYIYDKNLWKADKATLKTDSMILRSLLKKELRQKFNHHHHIVLAARISLTLSRHSSLSFIALGRSSGQQPVSSHSCWMYVRAGRPAFAWPCVGIHKSTSLMSSSLLLQQCPACLRSLIKNEIPLNPLSALFYPRFYLFFSSCQIYGNLPFLHIYAYIYTSVYWKVYWIWNSCDDVI